MKKTIYLLEGRVFTEKMKRRFKILFDNEFRKENKKVIKNQLKNGFIYEYHELKTILKKGHEVVLCGVADLFILD